MKRNPLWYVVPLLALVGVVFMAFAFFGTHTISLTEEQIQTHVDAQLGKEIDVKGLKGFVVKTVTLNSADVDLKDDRLEVLVDLSGTVALDNSFTFKVRALGNPAYGNGRFYFKTDEVEILDYEGPGSGTSNRLGALVDRYVTNEGLNNLASDIGGSVLEWTKELAQKTAIHVLETQPVYTLKGNIQGYVISAALQKVEVVGDTLKVTFSLMQLTMSLLWGAILVVMAIGLTFALLRNPTLLFAFMLIPTE